MPRPRRSNLSAQSRGARRQRKIVAKMTEEEKAIKRERDRVQRARYRASLPEEQKEATRNRRPIKKDRRTKRDLSSADLNRSVPHSRSEDSEILPICRMCLSTDSTLEPLTSDELGDYLYQKIFDCTGVQLLPSERCPSYLCSTCKSSLDALFMFRWRCKRNVEMVNRFLEYQIDLIKSETNADWPDDYMHATNGAGAVEEQK